MRATGTSGRLWALLVLLLCFNVALAGVVRPLARQDAAPATDAAAPNPTPVDEDDGSASTSASVTSAPDADASPSPSSTTRSSTSSTITAEVSATPFVGNGDTFANSTAPGQLPLKPVRTPGNFAAALVLMITGLVMVIFANYRILIYCFLSVAYSMAVGLTMIILLLVPAEVSAGLQGGLVAVVIVGSSIVAGCTCLKPLACEPFGCLLGGFCFGMWLLTLGQSGLLGQEKISNGIFLSAFSVLALIPYFMRLTKHYSMMVSSAFAGATAVIIGIDFVSNAGLKEYWAWIWDLNEDLFPFDANTYPLKMGIKVEQGATIVLFMAGVAAQWSRTRKTKEKQAKKDLEARAGNIAVQRADEKAGLEFARKIASEKDAFESRHGGSKMPTYQGRGSRMDKFLVRAQKGWGVLKNRGAKQDDELREAEITPDEACDVARADLKDRGVQERRSTDRDPNSEAKNQSLTTLHTKHDSCHSLKNNRDSGTTIVRTPTAPDERDMKLYEMSPASPTKPSTTAQQDIEMDEIRPAAPVQPTAAEIVMGRDEDAGCVMIHVAIDEVELAAAARAAQNPVPEVIPLPFKLPTSEDEREEVDSDDDDCSSLAVITDAFPDREVNETQSIHSKRGSFATRLSTSSVDLFRRLSQRSMSEHLGKGHMGDSESTEKLNAARRGERDSIEATFDDMSSVDENDLPAAASPTSERQSSREIKAELADTPTDVAAGSPEATAQEAVEKNSGDELPSEAAVAANMPSVQEQGNAIEEEKPSPEASEPSTKDEGKQAESTASDDDVGSAPGMSQVFVASSAPQTLETGKLDTRVSQAVQTYRMVDWVKHQTKADEPQIENLDIPELCDPTPPRPVDVEDLVKTAGDGAVRVAKPRTASAMQEWARRGVTAQPKYPTDRSRLSTHPEYDRNNYMTSDQRRQAAIQATAAALAGAPVRHASSIPSQITADSLRSRPPVPGIKPCNGPQSLVAKRETMIRMKEQALRPHSFQPAQDFGAAYGTVPALGPSSLTNVSNSSHSSSSRRTSGTYRSPNMSNPMLSELADDDNMPMRQRQALIRERRSSMGSSPSSNYDVASSESSSSRAYAMVATPDMMGGSSSSSSAIPSASPLALHNANVPHAQRPGSIVPAHVRESQLADFRSSVQSNLRASSEVLPVASPIQQSGFGGGYRSNNMTPLVGGPLINSVYNAIPGTSSSNSLLPQQTQAWNAGVSREMEMHRQSMLAHKSAEDRRRELMRAERKRQSQLRETNTEGIMNAHDEMMFRLQKKAKPQ